MVAVKPVFFKITSLHHLLLNVFRLFFPLKPGLWSDKCSPASNMRQLNVRHKPRRRSFIVSQSLYFCVTDSLFEQCDSSRTVTTVPMNASPTAATAKKEEVSWVRCFMEATANFSDRWPSCSEASSLNAESRQPSVWIYRISACQSDGRLHNL